MTTYAYVGCRTSAWRGARGKGIEVFRITDSGVWERLQCIASIQDNPSWLTIDIKRNRLYALHGDGDRVGVFKRDPATGLLGWLHDQTTGPRHPNPDLDPNRKNNPVSASLTPDMNTLLIANHEGGNVAALPISDEGLLPPVHYAKIPGHTHAAMTLSRPHEVVFAPDGPLFAVPAQGRPAGKGIDMMRLYRWEHNQICLLDEVRLPTGSWPRHADFHPNGRWLYGISELSGTVTAFDIDAIKGTLSLKQTLSTLPEGYTQRNDASEVEVHPSGRFLYAANRGHDSIAVFEISQYDGGLSPIGWVPCGGKTPRFTTLSPDGRTFYSANEDSDNIQVFNVDSTTGMLLDTGISITSASPTCICFA
ncbi:6-phosphogluconolactonase [Leminorella grimontii]|uniref:6-phosphogluconolactonase n=1 Tax=Leminorella grimontii TaxID=82981 RepID=A0AAV5MXU0_9GAMM|nr:lactonase family protein [Leminorella grimontii]KFC96158.1 6-phosphogluconolactonase [Leminorella grimontii ATCC 33999 = DSM 5078]GKX54656.1 6-phosphogluconolactonase [Leminorella grimontii]VFS58733.1 6-phosphogluconolactonase [Leminorella grimontii]